MKPRKQKTERQKQKDRLDKMCSKYIRRRDFKKYGGCMRCGGKKKSWHELDWSHYIPRTLLNLRWDEDNALALCKGCHTYLDHRAPAEEKEAFFVSIIGEDKADMLKARRRYTGKADLDLIEIYLTEKLKELGK